MAESPPKLSDDEAVAALHLQLSPMLLRLASAMLRDAALAEDAVQEAFLLLTNHWTEIPEAQRIGWLVRTVQLCSLNLRRTRQRQQQLMQRWLASLTVSASPGQALQADHPEWVEQLACLQNSLARLPRQQQEVVRLRLVEEKTFQEIADQLQLPLGTVLSRMRLAVEKLRNQLQ